MCNQLENIEEMLFFDIERRVRSDMLIIAKNLLIIEAVTEDDKISSSRYATILSIRNRVGYIFSCHPLEGLLSNAIRDKRTLLMIHTDAIEEMSAETGIRKECFRKEPFTVEELLYETEK